MAKRYQRRCFCAKEIELKRLENIRAQQRRRSSKTNDLAEMEPTATVLAQ
jgi:hypothetical protein